MRSLLHPRVAFAVPALAGLLCLLVSKTALAAVPLILPDGELAEPWRAALPLGGRIALDPGLPRVSGAPWVELERTVDVARWRLRVRDEAGVLHEVEVAVPADARAREEVVALAASLLHSVGGGLGFWPAHPAEEAAPLLPPPPPPVAPAPRETAAVLSPSPRPRINVSPAHEALAPAVEAPAEALAPLAEAPAPEAASPEPAPLEGPAVEAPVEPAVAPPPAPPVTPAPAPPVNLPPESRVVVWSRLAGSADLGLGLDGPTAGGSVQAGLRLRPSWRAGVGFQAELRQVFQIADVDEARRPAQRDTDVFGVLLWSPSWRVAPLLALRGGWTVRRAYVRERSAQGSWAWQEVLDQDGDALAPLPFAGLEAGLSVPLGSSLHLEPYAQVQALLVRSVDSATFAPGLEATFPRWSAHAGLALRLEPGT